MLSFESSIWAACYVGGGELQRHLSLLLSGIRNDAFAIKPSLLRQVGQPGIRWLHAAVSGNRMRVRGSHMQESCLHGLDRLRGTRRILIRTKELAQNVPFPHQGFPKIRGTLLGVR